ncbi:class I SAM-dependent methyltransferase [Paractinoplanes rhizophilus]|uniref:Class I SAM-dependent methyltransferase n=1 Tax=Paractinoplanes rhizophilus TaxID=1416877 RepID=A0ABW2I4M6_9ACTN
MSEDFFRTGEEEVELTFERITSFGYEIRRASALDFGCGVGRLTQAMATRFQIVDGVDIAPSMVRQARALNRHGLRCRYFLNNAHDLKAFTSNSYDFVLSLLVLQHMEPRYSSTFIGELVRVLAPGGMLVMNMPSQVSLSPLGLMTAAVPRTVVNAVVATRRGRHGVREVHRLRREAVREIVRRAGGTTCAEEADVAALGKRWKTYRYYVGKRRPSHEA